MQFECKDLISSFSSSFERASAKPRFERSGSDGQNPDRIGLTLKSWSDRNSLKIPGSEHFKLRSNLLRVSIRRIGRFSFVKIKHEVVRVLEFKYDNASGCTADTLQNWWQLQFTTACSKPKSTAQIKGWDLTCQCFVPYNFFIAMFVFNYILTKKTLPFPQMLTLI